MDNLAIITARFGTDFKRATEEEITYNCPFCESKRGKADKDHKLYVNTRKLKFHCFKCNTSGSLKVEGSKGVTPYGVYAKLLNFKPAEEEEEENMFYIPTAKIEEGMVAYDYCLSRGITKEMIDYYDIRFGLKELSGRIVIPNEVYGDCWTDMYSARSIINQTPKYLNPSGADKTTIVFNLDRIPDNPDRIVIVEGVITAICGGKDCVAVYGCHPSRVQIEKILSKNPKSIYCCLDGDSAGQSGLDPLLEDIINLQYNGTLYYVIMPEDKDACDMGYEVFRKYIEENKHEYYGNVYKKLMIFGEKYRPVTII